MNFSQLHDALEEYRKNFEEPNAEKNFHALAPGIQRFQQLYLQFLQSEALVENLKIQSKILEELKVLTDALTEEIPEEPAPAPPPEKKPVTKQKGRAEHAA